MGYFAYLAPVGPFAGLSNPARQKIASAFPTLSIAEIENAAEAFLLALKAPEIEPRLAEARDELNTFAGELARFQHALKQIRRHRLDHAIGEVSRIISGENELEEVDRSLNLLRTATRQTSRALPPGRSELASRRFVATLARQVRAAGLPLSGTSGNSLLSLVDLIFDDLMVGGDAPSAVREWHQSEAANIDQERTSMLLDLVS